MLGKLNIKLRGTCSENSTGLVLIKPGQSKARKFGFSLFLLMHCFPTHPNILELPKIVTYQIMIPVNFLPAIF